MYARPDVLGGYLPLNGGSLRGVGRTVAAEFVGRIARRRRIRCNGPFSGRFGFISLDRGAILGGVGTLPGPFGRAGLREWEFIRMAQLQRYDGRRVLITGGGSGIGQASVLRILDEGGSVVAADISEAGLQDTLAKAPDAGNRLGTVVMDVGNEESVRRGVTTRYSAWGPRHRGQCSGCAAVSAFRADDTGRIRTGAADQSRGTFLVTRESIAALRIGTSRRWSISVPRRRCSPIRTCRPTPPPRAASSR